MTSYSDVHRILCDGDECVGCEYSVKDYDLRRCLVIDNGSDPEFCPGAATDDNVDAEDLDFIPVVPALSAYDE